MIKSLGHSDDAILIEILQIYPKFETRHGLVLHCLVDHEISARSSIEMVKISTNSQRVSSYNQEFKTTSLISITNI